MTLYTYAGSANTEELKQLKEMHRNETNARMSLRYHVILLWLQEENRKDIAEKTHIAYDTVNEYINKYKKGGIKGLSMGKSTGPRKKLTPRQETQLVDCITKNTPKDVGFAPHMNWTADLACQWVKREFSVAYADRSMRKIFYRLGLSWTRPTYTLKKADPKKQEEFLNDFALIKKN